MPNEITQRIEELLKKEQVLETLEAFVKAEKSTYVDKDKVLLIISTAYPTKGKNDTEACADDNF